MIRVEDIQFVNEGLIIRLRRVKSCPVKATASWLVQSGISSGALFRSVDRYSHVTEYGLSPQSVALIVKQRADAIGLDSRQFSGHIVTSAAKSGASTWKICQQTGHQSEAVMQRYIRDSHLFTDNPLGKIR